MSRTTILILLTAIVACSNTSGTSTKTPDAAIPQNRDAREVVVDAKPNNTQSASSTATSITTKTETKTDAGTTPDSLPPQLVPDAQVVQLDALPAAQDTLPQVTPDTQPAQQPDALPMTVDTKPATPDTLVLVDTKPATPDVLPATDTLPATSDTLPSTQPEECGGDNQACCLIQTDETGAWIHTCANSVNGTYDCTITKSTAWGTSASDTLQVPAGTIPLPITDFIGADLYITNIGYSTTTIYCTIVNITASGSYDLIVLNRTLVHATNVVWYIPGSAVPAPGGPTGTCEPCGYKGYPGCTYFNIHGFSGKWNDIMTGTCDHDGNLNPVCTGDICLCP
jgi:hypothetical protein